MFTIMRTAIFKLKIFAIGLSEFIMMTVSLFVNLKPGS